MICILNNTLYCNHVWFVLQVLKYIICDKSEVWGLLYHFKYKNQITVATSFFALNNPVFSNVCEI